MTCLLCGGDGGIFWQDPTLHTSSPARCSDLSPGSAYTFRVRAQNCRGWGDWSPKSAEVTPSVDADISKAASVAGSIASSRQPPRSIAAGAAIRMGRSPGSVRSGAGSVSSRLDDAATRPFTHQAAYVDAHPQPLPTPAAFPAMSDEVADLLGSGDLSALKKAHATDPKSVNTIDSRMRTAVHIAAAAGHLAVVQWLVEEVHAPWDTVDSVGATPLLLAGIDGHIPVVDWLGSKGACLDVADKKGYSAAHYAVMKRQPVVLQYLLECGADPMRASDSGNRLIDTLKAKRAVALEQLAASGDVPPSPALNRVRGAASKPTKAAGQGSDNSPDSAALREQVRAYDRMLALYANASAVPAALSPPNVADTAHNSALLLFEPVPSLPPGCPVHTAFEVRFMETRDGPCILSLNTFPGPYTPVPLYPCPLPLR